jgi:predicted phosphatase
MYQQIYSFNELSKYKEIFAQYNCVFFFDVQGVIIRNNNFHEALLYRKFSDQLKNLCLQQNENYIKISKFGRFFKSKLTEEILPKFLNELRNLGVELCLLTFARYSADRERTLKNHKILSYFHKQIWAGGINKGLLITEYLKIKVQENKKIDKVFFIDDKKEHLDTAKIFLDIYQEKNQDIEYELLSYQKYPVYPVNEFDFLKFWRTVIQVYKNNKLQKNILNTNEIQSQD